MPGPCPDTKECTASPILASFEWLPATAALWQYSGGATDRDHKTVFLLFLARMQPKRIIFKDFCNFVAFGCSLLPLLPLRRQSWHSEKGVSGWSKRTSPVVTTSPQPYNILFYGER